MERGSQDSIKREAKSDGIILCLCDYVYECVCVCVCVYVLEWEQGTHLFSAKIF